MRHINEGDIDWKAYEQEGHEFRRKELTNAVAAEQLGCSLYELPSGNRSWPYHYHTANEEALFVLDGTGIVRLNGDERPLESGDFVAFPATEDGGHQVVNDSSGSLRYLVVSTMEEPDVTVYPEMEKFGVYVGSPPGGREERTFEGYFPLDADTEYWE
ncbi:cupin domain-containing protein [Halovenus rubra]|uniref:Cupin domain-containing protein n=2 Tax=Halovenus rubra TaxID=869890 RepID=A0ABD5X6L2_9EURY|nr:cupin domain-containing protein [Halovenus rubra]